MQKCDKPAKQGNVIKISKITGKVWCLVACLSMTWRDKPQFESMRGAGGYK